MNKIKYLFGLVLVTPLIAFAPVMAATEISIKSSDTSVKTTVATPATVTEDTGIAEVNKDPVLMKKRLEILKTTLKTKLDDATSKRILLKCKPSQSVVQVAETNDKSNGTKRIVAYKKISDGQSAAKLRQHQ